MPSLILFQFSTISRLILHKYSSHSLGGACLQMMFEIFWLWNLIKTERVPTFEDASSYHGDFHNLLTFDPLSEWPCMFEGRRVILEEYCDFYLSWAIIFWHRTFRLNQWRINAIPARPSLVPYSSVLLRCFFCNLFALNFYPNTSEDKFWNLSISWFSFSGQLEPTIFNYSLAFCLFLMGESCASLNMYKT